MPETSASSGASAPLTIDGSLAGRRLDAALGELLPGLGVRARRRLIEGGGLLLNGRRVRAPGLTVRRGDVLRLVESPVAAVASAPWSYPAQQPRVLRHDAPYLFLFKPAGLHTVALGGGSAPSLESLLPALLPAPPRLLQRLDFETSGLICATSSAEGGEAFRTAEARNEVCKGYLALLQGSLETPVTARAAIAMDGGATVRIRAGEEEDAGRWTSFVPLVRWRTSETAAVAEALGMPAPDGPLTLAACRIGRGARHQIRAHAAWLGLPLWGDARYGGSGTHFFLHHGRFHMASIECRCLPPWLAALAGLPGDAPGAARRWLEAPVPAVGP